MECYDFGDPSTIISLNQHGISGIECEEDTSSKILSYQLDNIYSKEAKYTVLYEGDTSSQILPHEPRELSLQDEKNTDWMTDINKFTSYFYNFFNYFKEKTTPIWALHHSLTESFNFIKPFWEGHRSLIQILRPVWELQLSFSPIFNVIKTLEPIFRMKEVLEPIFATLRTIEPLIDSDIEQEEDILNLEDFKEPNNLIVNSDLRDELILDSESFEKLVDDLKNVKFNKKLAEFYSKIEEEIENLTEE